MKITVLQNLEQEGPARIADWAQVREITLDVRVLSDKSTPMSVDAVADGLVVLGGPMSAWQSDEFPQLGWQRELLAAAIEEQLPILGICLGAQLMALSQGAKVTSLPKKEIGWHPLKFMNREVAARYFDLNDEPVLMPMWHGDSFDLPKKGVWLASSEHTAHQAFMLAERQIGVQFHPEWKETNLSYLIGRQPQDLIPAPSVQLAPQMLNRTARWQAGQRQLYHLLDAIFLR